MICLALLIFKYVFENREEIVDEIKWRWKMRKNDKLYKKWEKKYLSEMRD